MATDNTFNGNKFEIHMPKTPILEKAINMVDIGGLTLNEVELQHRHLLINRAGEKIVYGKLDLTFILDENLDTYYEVYSNMNATAGTTVDIEKREMFVQDVTVSILNNTNGTVVRKFTFIDCWFSFLGELSLDVGDSQILTSSCTMTYDYFKLDPPQNDVTGYSDKSYDVDIEER